MMIIDPPVASYSPRAKILDWITQLESALEDPDAEPFDLMRIEEYLETARGWIEKPQHPTPLESGTAA
jgi:hypothetical protein